MIGDTDAPLPERHMNLLQIIMELKTPDSQLTRAEVVREAADRNLGYWHIFKDVRGQLRSQEVLEDVNHLHNRGYIFDSGQEILLTRRAEILYDRMGER